MDSLSELRPSKRTLFEENGKIYKDKLSKLDKEFSLFINNLNKIGYNCSRGYRNDIKQRLLTIAFQRRFRQELVDGKIDKECFLISKNLV